MASFERQALPLADFLLRMGRRLTGEQAAAEDLVQDAYLKAWRSFDSFREGTNFRGWIGRILYRTFLNDQAKRRRWVRLEDPDAFALPAGREGASPGADVIRRVAAIPTEHFGDDVLGALRELPEEMALAVYLADVEELTYDEIADVLSCPVGTVRSRIARGRRHLHDRLLEVARNRGIVGRESS